MPGCIVSKSWYASHHVYRSVHDGNAIPSTFFCGISCNEIKYSSTFLWYMRAKLTILDLKAGFCLLTLPPFLSVRQILYFQCGLYTSKAQGHFYY